MSKSDLRALRIATARALQASEDNLEALMDARQGAKAIRRARLERSRSESIRTRYGVQA